MNCAFCLFDPLLENYFRESVTTMVDGTSLCPDHARDVLTNAPWVSFWPNGRLCLQATIEALQDFNKEGNAT